MAAGGIFFYYYKMSVQNFGGITGDLAGWFLQVCELGILLSAVIGGGISGKTMEEIKGGRADEISDWRSLSGKRAYAEEHDSIQKWTNGETCLRKKFFLRRMVDFHLYCAGCCRKERSSM